MMLIIKNSTTFRFNPHFIVTNTRILQDVIHFYMRVRFYEPKDRVDTDSPLLLTNLQTEHFEKIASVWFCYVDVAVSLSGWRL